MPNYYNNNLPVYQPSATMPYAGSNPWPNYYTQMNNGSQAYQNQMAQMSGYSAQPQMKMRVKWVGGIVEAHSSTVEPNEMLIMLDSNVSKMYFKSAGPDGRPTPLMESDYTQPKIVDQNSSSSANMDMSQFATKDDFNQLKQMLEDLTKPGNNNG